MARLLVVIYCCSRCKLLLLLLLRPLEEDQLSNLALSTMDERVDENAEPRDGALAEVPMAKANANANAKSAPLVLSRYDALQDVVQLRADLR